MRGNITEISRKSKQMPMKGLTWLSAEPALWITFICTLFITKEKYSQLTLKVAAIEKKEVKLNCDNKHTRTCDCSSEMLSVLRGRKTFFVYGQTFPAKFKSWRNLVRIPFDFQRVISSSMRRCQAPHYFFSGKYLKKKKAQGKKRKKKLLIKR